MALRAGVVAEQRRAAARGRADGAGARQACAEERRHGRERGAAAAAPAPSASCGPAPNCRPQRRQGREAQGGNALSSTASPTVPRLFPSSVHLHRKPPPSAAFNRQEKSAQKAQEGAPPPHLCRQLVQLGHVGQQGVVQAHQLLRPRRALLVLRVGSAVGSGGTGGMDRWSRAAPSTAGRSWPSWRDNVFLVLQPSAARLASVGTGAAPAARAYAAATRSHTLPPHARAGRAAQKEHAMARRARGTRTPNLLDPAPSILCVYIDISMYRQKPCRAGLQAAPTFCPISARSRPRARRPAASRASSSPRARV